VTEPLRTRRYVTFAGRGGWMWMVVAAAAAAILAVVVGPMTIGGSGSSEAPRPVQIAPPARSTTPAQEARNLSAWLRRHSG
jgi:hypothetical protein